ncbi:MAG: YbaK/EbsC family protein [Candidatus Nanopelagicales bacterium]
MSEPMEQQSVIRVRERLALLGASGEVRRLDDSARTAKEAADALGIEVGQIASSLIFLADGAPVLVIASGGHRVDTQMLAAILEVAVIGKASADDVRAATSFAIGGVPPFGHTTQLRVFVDPDLLQYDEVWAAAGTWNDNFGAAPADIVRVAGGVVTDLKRD